MEKLLSFIHFLVLFVVCCFANLEPKMKACIDNYELSFFCDAKNFNDAKKICEEHESYLVKIDNANIEETIKDVIDKINCPYSEDYHAGATADNNRKWTWLDGSEVYLPNEGGYQNWRDWQPNDFLGREDCMKLDKYTTKWFDSPCAGTGTNGQPAEDRYYICQKNLTLTIMITKLSHNTLKCSATNGSCVDQVEWRQNNETVSTFQNHSVYQKFSSGTSILHYENATINHAGKYSCVTRVTKNERNKVSVTKVIQVNGTPTIEVIIPSPCNSSLVLYWHPNKHALGYPHRIVVNDLISGELMKNITDPPVNDVQHKLKIINLQPFTAYNIQISACIDEASCTTDHTANATATTFGIVIKNATMRRIDDNDTCIVTWNSPHYITTAFKLEINSDSGLNTSTVNRSANKTDEDLIFSFEMQPEQTYEVQIQANGSNEFCPQPVNVVGTCRGRDIPTTTTAAATTITGGQGHTINLIHTSTFVEADLSRTNALSDITMIVLPVSVGVFVILIFVGIVICCKRSQNVKTSKENPIYGVTNNAALESTYDHLHSSSDKQENKRPEESTQPSPEVVFNPLYGDIGMDTSPGNQDIDGEANTEDNDATVYAAISKPNRKIPNKVFSSEELYSKSLPSTSQQDDDVYAVVDKNKKY